MKQQSPLPEIDALRAPGQQHIRADVICHPSVVISLVVHFYDNETICLTISN
jgi:hypothetical protein